MGDRAVIGIGVFNLGDEHIAETLLECRIILHRQVKILRSAEDLVIGQLKRCQFMA